MADDDIFSGIESAELIDSGASAQPLLDTARMLGKRPREREEPDSRESDRQDATTVRPTCKYTVDIAVSEDKGNRQDMEGKVLLRHTWLLKICRCVDGVQ